MDTASLLRQGVLDTELAALLWLLGDGGVPLVVAGSASAATRSALAGGLLAIDPTRRWVVLDADADEVTADRLVALLRGGIGLGISVAASDLEGVLLRMVEGGLPEDAVRRLGVVVIAEETPDGLRCTVVHYLRPAERDAHGHVQRRPPAVLAAWDERADAYEDYAWGITPELGDRVDRSQADFEERRIDRARFLASLEGTPDAYPERVRAYLATEPSRVRAPERESARPSPFSGGLTDPDPHSH